MFSMLGGLQGLEVLERNCQVLIDLASYVQRWYPEALVVSEQLRLNARELEWHVGRLKGAAQTGNLQTAFADYAQRTVVIYYVMTRNVLELYTRASLPGLIQLEAALLCRQFCRRRNTAATVPTTSISFLNRQRLLDSYERG